jgi:hypothetical protein
VPAHIDPAQHRNVCRHTAPNHTEMAEQNKMRMLRVNLFLARPHPGLFPMGEGMAIAAFWYCE